MKVSIKSYYGELPKYLTMGKYYNVVGGSGVYLDIIGDNGEMVCLDTNSCDHLNGGAWWVEND